MTLFRVFRIHQGDGGEVQPRFESLSLGDLEAGEVLVRAHYSCVNYKDALAGTGRGRILRRYPLIGGIDVAGEVVHSDSPDYSPGEQVLVTGCGLSETRDGGYSSYVSLPAACLVPLPSGMTSFEAMAIGTAGFSAALSVMRMEDNHQYPGLGPILVTGATGGVGSYAIDLLAGVGYEVHAQTGKPGAEDYLRHLGAVAVHDRHTQGSGHRALESAEWGGAVDVVGGDTLAWLTRTVRPQGNIAAVGMASGAQLNTTVFPFILRGIGLLGINSADCPVKLRRAVWARLASDLRPRHWADMVAETVRLDDLPRIFDDLLGGSILGRVVVDLSD